VIQTGGNCAMKQLVIGAARRRSPEIETAAARTFNEGTANG
jgi:hypothetical protein